MTLTELAIKRPSLIIIIFAALGVLGIFSYKQLSYELLPKIAPPVLTITTLYPGASPSEVQSSVSKVIEDAVSGLDKITDVFSTSTEGLSMVFVNFEQSADVDFALREAEKEISKVASQLPAGSKTPALTRFALDEFPVLRLGATGNLPSKEFYQFLKDRVQPAIAHVAGVGQVTMVGGDEREIKINLDEQKLRAHNISILQVTQAVKNANLDFPTGKVKDFDGEYVVRIAGKFTSLNELRSMVVAESPDGGAIRLADVAEVEDGQKEYTNISRINGTTSVGILILKQSDANTVEVSKLVRAEINRLVQQYNDINLKIDVAQDGSTFTLDAANAVKNDLGVAILLVAIVMLLFLHSIRNSLMVMVAIPASLVSTLIAVYAFGFTLNLMTLLGMSLVIGILVDDSIVVLENIYHHMEKGEERRKASVTGRNEIGFAALAITLVDVAVFVPIILVNGLVGNIMRQFAVVVVVSTLMSLFVSFTLTPLLASRFAMLERLNKGTFLGSIAIAFEKLYEKIAAEYQVVLKWSLAHKKTIGAMTVLLFIASVALIPLGFIGGEFITQADRGEFAVTLELPAGSTIEQTNLVTRQIEQLLTKVPEVTKVMTNVGVSNEGWIGMSSNNFSELDVTLLPKEQRAKTTSEVGQEIKAIARGVPGVKVRVNEISIFGTANQTPVQVVVNGTNYDEVRKGADQLADLMRNIPGTTDVRLSSEDGNPETRVEIDRDKIAAFGLNVAEVGQTLRVAFNGDDESKYRDGQNDYDIRIQLDEFDRTRTADVGNLTFTNREGKQIELKQFANIYQTTGPTKMQRWNRNYAVWAYAQVNGRASGDIGNDIKKGLLQHPLPAGLDVSYQGDLKLQSDSNSNLGLALLAAVLFTYMIMVALYDSFVYPFVVLFSIPVAMVGALLALALTMKTMNIFSMLGIIMLVGLVGKNAILLVDRTNQMKRERGMGTIDAVLEAGEARLRPILMTTLAMIFGMLPIAMHTSAGAEWKSGLAWALVGGLTSSLLLTLVLVPVVYVKVDQWRERVPAFFRRLFRMRVGVSQPEIVASEVASTGEVLAG